jgi:hypothetical protein
VQKRAKYFCRRGPVRSSPKIDALPRIQIGREKSIKSNALSANETGETQIFYFSRMLQVYDLTRRLLAFVVR